MKKQSSGSVKSSKPAKPHPDFPLFPHATGRWAKKVRGEFHFFGPWRDPQGALEEWLRTKDDLLAGRKPRDKNYPGGPTIEYVTNAYGNNDCATLTIAAIDLKTSGNGYSLRRRRSRRRRSEIAIEVARPRR